MSNIQVAAVFSNNMVLQREKIINVFGWLGNGSGEVCIKAQLFNKKGDVIGENVRTFAQEPREKWVISLPPQKAQEECTLKISTGGEEEITFTNISIGEVWLAGGQSNMEFELGNCTEGPEALADTTGENGAKNVRFYYTNKIFWMDEHFYEAERNTAWQTWDSPNKNTWSAVGFFFARKLAQDLGCTVGVIGCNWGGTSASAWMRREYLEKDDDLRTYLTEQEEGTAGKSIEQQSNTPCGLYDCMVNRVLPYTLKGVLWYQGESDDHKPYSYAKLFSKLIDNWRTDWNDSQLPFVFVQLPCHRNEYDKDFKHWCLIRAAQEKVHRMVTNTFMTCALDLGQFNDIHPKAKKVLAERMEQNALANVYLGACGKKPEDVLSPMVKTFIMKGADPSSSNSFGKIVLTFENVSGGFVAREDKINLDYYKQMEQYQGNSVSPAFTGFEIAGEDNVFYPAAYRLGQQPGELNTITVSSPLVKNPVAVRYGWYNYGPVNIYGKNGLPLAPFSVMV